MPRLSLHLLGPPRLELDGEPLNIGRLHPDQSRSRKWNPKSSTYQPLTLSG
jgi:hypothetical protein